MFDVGFSEIVLIAVIALLVVGPKEFPALVRNIGSWLGKARHFMSAVKTEFDREIAELHENLDVDRRADRPTVHPSSSPDQLSASQTQAATPPGVTGEATASAGKQDHGKPQA